MGAMLCGAATASKTTKLRKGGSDCSRFEVGGFWRRWVKWKIMRIYIVNDKFSLAPDILIYTLQSLGTSQLTLIFFIIFLCIKIYNKIYYITMLHVVTCIANREDSRP